MIAINRHFTDCYFSYLFRTMYNYLQTKLEGKINSKYEALHDR